MCNLCSGSRVVYNQISVGTIVQPCPSCQPLSEENQAKRDEAFWSRWHEADALIRLTEKEVG
jgi:hypothetical protein